MLKEKNNLIQQFILIIDASVVTIAFLAAVMLRDYFTINFIYPLPDISDWLPVILLIIPLWLLMLKFFGVYNSMRGKSSSRIFWGVFEASLVSTFLFAAAAYLLELEVMSRPFVLSLFGGTVLLLTIEKMIGLYLLRNVRRHGMNYRVVLIVGSGPRARSLAESIESHPEWGLKIFGFVDEPEMMGMTVGNGKVIGTFKDLGSILEENVVDEVMFVMPRKWLANLEKYIKVCEKIGVKATIAVDFFDTAIAKPVVKEMDGWPLLTFDTTPRDYFSLSLKRFLDIIGSAGGLIALSPIFLALAILIKANSRGPVFFSQIRCGLRGRPFKILKFRTMIVDAEAKLKELRKMNELEGPAFKIKNDPRVTAVGRFLRKTSLDELPQLINVLMGDMSLVGPRPPLPTEVEKYERWQRRRLSMRPGITCIHEVVARNNKDFNCWMKLDLEYIDNWCFGLDLKILARTVLAVMKGTGC